MSTEVMIPVADVSAWLSRVDPAEARRLLVGCSLDDGKSEELGHIVEIDVARRLLVLEHSRRVPLRTVAGGRIVEHREDAPLARAIEASLTPFETRERRERETLRRYDIDIDKLASLPDRQAVLDFMAALEKGTGAGYRQREAFYEAMSRTGDPKLARIGARTFAHLAERFHQAGRLADDIPWRRARLLRMSDQLGAAVEISEAVFSGVIADSGARKILATVRAAVLMDIFVHDGRREPAILAQAKKAMALAYALGPDDEEAKALYIRYKSLGGI